jgi:hypothetical protein
MAQLNFDANNVEPSESFGVLPEGKYLCMAVASEIKPTKSGTGEYLEITFEVLDGQGKGRKVWERLNIRNANKKAEEISQRQLSALCRAVGVLNLQDSDQLHNLPVVLDIEIEQREGYSPQNRVKGYNASGSSAPVASSPALRSSAPAAAPAASGAPVWKKKATA